MDPLSITVSVVALLQLTTKVISYVKEAKNEPKGQTRILHEAFSLMGLLNMLKDLVEDSDSQDPWLQATSALAAPNGPLHQYKLALEGLVGKVMPSGHGNSKVMQALTWKFSKEEITDLLLQIERVKSFVLIALEIDHTFVSLFFIIFASSALPSPQVLIQSARKPMVPAQEPQ